MLDCSRFVTRIRRWIGFFWTLGLLLLAAGFLGACGADELPPGPLDHFRPAMRPEFQQQLDELIDLPRYAIEIELKPDENLLLGQADIRIVNTSPDLWKNLVFRLYPMLSHYKGKMVLQSAVVNQAAAPFGYEAHTTAVRIALPKPLAPKEVAQVHLNWQLEIPALPDKSDSYVLFGASQQMLTLPLFYPSLAVYKPEARLEPGVWWLDEGTIRGDAAFSVASLFMVTATMPADQVPVTSGTLITSTFVGENLARHVWVTGPSREFLLHTSRLFRTTFTEANGTRVTSYWLPGQEAMGIAALNDAIAALRIYSDRFGPYPYRDLRIAPAPLSFRGMEYPQVSLIGVELYDRFRGDLEILVAHEVAHQWWYQMVHNDPVNEPWLDEALAEYSVKLYFEDLHGQKQSDKVLLNRWQIPVNGLENQDNDLVLDQAVDAFASSSQYETIIYGKGALFYDTLRQTLGKRRFERFLQSYLTTHLYQIVDTADWADALRTLNNPALQVQFDEWVKKPTEDTAVQSLAPAQAAP